MGVADALRMMNAGLDYLNGPDGADLDAAACGSVLRSLGEIEAKFTAAHASVLARFDAADAHDCDGYGTSATWLTAMADMTPRDAKVKMREMRLLRAHPDMAAALAAKDISVGTGDRRLDQEAARGAARGDDHDPGAGRSGRGVAG